MRFNLYANYLQHKRLFHAATAPATADALACTQAAPLMDAARDSARAPPGEAADEMARMPVGGTPAMAADAATGVFGSSSYSALRDDDDASVDGLSPAAHMHMTPPPLPAFPAACPIPVSTSSMAVANRIAAYYRAKGDLGRTKLYVPLNKRDRPSDFITKEHKDMRLFALSSGGCGLSRKAKAEYYKTTVSIERAAMRMIAEAAARRKKRKKGKNGKGKPGMLSIKIGPLESAFPSAASFVRSLEGEKWRCLAELEWRETSIPVRGNVYAFYSRNIMTVATDALTTALKVCLRGQRKHDDRGNVVRTNSLDSDIYLQEQEDVHRLHAGKKDGGNDMPPFTLAVQLFSDAALVSWNGSKFTPPPAHDDSLCCLIPAAEYSFVLTLAILHVLLFCLLWRASVGFGTHDWLLTSALHPLRLVSLPLFSLSRTWLLQSVP